MYMYSETPKLGILMYPDIAAVILTSVLETFFEPFQ